MELADGWIGLSRIERRVYAGNERAVSFCRKFGFSFGGTAPLNRVSAGT